MSLSKTSPLFLDDSDSFYRHLSMIKTRRNNICSHSRDNECLTVSVPLGKGGEVGEVGDDHQGTHQTDGAALHTKAHGEPIEHADLQLTGMDLSQMGHWARSETSLLTTINTA